MLWTGTARLHWVRCYASGHHAYTKYRSCGICQLYQIAMRRGIYQEVHNMPSFV